MTPALKHAILNGISLLGIPSVFRRSNRHRPAVLMFHGFTDCVHTGLENCQHKHLDLNRFESFLRHLKENFHIIPLTELVNCLQKGTPPPPSSVVITFDDGFRSNYTLAYPLLKKYQAPATIYIATEFVDEKKPIWVDRVDYAFHKAGKNKSELTRTKKKLKSLPSNELFPALEELEHSTGFRLENSNGPQIPEIYHALDWDQVREMQASGLVEFGAHTHSHLIMGRCAPEIVEREVVTSKAIIERETGTSCRSFCYPNGYVGDFSEKSEEIIRTLGFESSLTTLGGFNDQNASPFLMKRLGVTNDLELVQFEHLMSGINRHQR